MAKKIRTVLTLQLPAGKATPAPPVGTALGPHGINIVEFTKTYNEKTPPRRGQIIPAQITIFEDRSFTFILKTPPAADLLRKAAGVEKGSATDRSREGRHGDPRPGPRDRRRPRWPTSTRTTSRAPRDHRGHGPLDGHRGRRLASHRIRPATHERRRRPPRAPGGGPHGAVSERSIAQWLNTARSTTGGSARRSRRDLRARRGRRPAQADRVRSSFDASAEAHIRLGVDPRHADQMVRGTVVLPHGTGKLVRVVVFAQGEKAQEALRAGADEVGGEDLVKRIEAGWLDFDVALATPDMMGMVGRLGRILGRRGLMPNPKSGTITFDIERAIARSRPAASSSRSTRAASSTCPSARPASSRSSSSRTWRRWWMRSIAPGPAPPRGSISRA